MEALADVYESLKGSKVDKGGRLCIDGFTGRDYEELYDYLISETIVHLVPNGMDFYDWLAQKAYAYYGHRIKKRFYVDRPDPIADTPAEQLDTRQQLSIFKFAIYRRVYSGYG